MSALPLTYLAVVSVQVLQLADITQGDPLRQRLRAHVRRGKGRQAVRRICKEEEMFATRAISSSQLWSLSLNGGPGPPARTDVLLVVLALCGDRLLRGAAAVLRAATHAVRQSIHLLERFEPTHTGADELRGKPGKKDSRDCL